MHKPVDGGGNHNSSSSPRQSKELVTQRRRDADVVSDVVDLVDALLARDGDEDAGDEQDEGCQAGEDEVDGVDAAAREEEEGADAGEHGQAGETNRQDVQDECREESAVEKVDGVLDVVGPVDISEA